MAKVMMSVLTTCPQCHKQERITVPAQGYLKWKRREENIQVAMPEVHAAQREQLITGLCPVCWEDLFAEYATCQHCGATVATRKQWFSETCPKQLSGKSCHALRAEDLGRLE